MVCRIYVEKCNLRHTISLLQEYCYSFSPLSEERIYKVNAKEAKRGTPSQILSISSCASAVNILKKLNQNFFACDNFISNNFFENNNNCTAFVSDDHFGEYENRAMSVQNNPNRFN